ncbi:hypothetical protein [Sciscionella sediminilitoris]|uniref:hypothetical protein n=1 Tax=Sciscionella sediminilitoris TaxID=1445613 RepID=UPI0004DEFD90|nr:hypothetical protein [Sciscionella sp. SE31]
MAGRLVTARRVWIALGCLAALALGIALAYWQWTRFESASGTLQNLGYVLQWPLFGFFPLFMVWRIWRYARRERAKEAVIDPGSAADPALSGQVVDSQPVNGHAISTRAGAEQPKARPSKMAYVAPTVAEDTAGDPALARYNAFLAELAAEDAADTPTKERP